MQFVELIRRDALRVPAVCNCVALVVLALTPSLGQCWSHASQPAADDSAFLLQPDVTSATQIPKLVNPVTLASARSMGLGGVQEPGFPSVGALLDAGAPDPVALNRFPHAVERFVVPADHAREFADHVMADPDMPRLVRHLTVLQSRYQRLADAGGWPVIPAGPDVGVGEVDERLVAVRERLAMTNDADSALGGAVLDDDLVAALGRFQNRVQLPPTGTLDAATLHQLNVSVESRLMSISLSLSRASVLPRGPEQDYVVVNIAGYQAEYMRGDEVLWSGKTMVGKTSTRTPQLESAIDRVVFNPTWIVPNGIASRSVLPALIKDPGYLKRKNMRVFNKQWQPVDPSTVDWVAVRASRNRDVYIRQDAGDDNALGKVKFLFPNRHSVYLHDTPNKHLFDKDARAFSNGCVRLENPMELASAILDGQGWDGHGMRAEAESNHTPKLIKLERPVPVHMVYLTASLGAGGGAVFHPDVYKENTAQAMAALQ